MRRLDCPVQKYAWGKEGSKSKVAQLKQLENPSWEADEQACYAELWMGTHPNGPSRVYPTDAEETEDPSVAKAGKIFLIELMETHPHYLGDLEDVGDLPFMFKILSINKALSIQAHPDKKTAERLYATRPDLYKDDNHKPEMAVALSKFEGLCGFRPFYEIVYNLHRYPELRGLVSLAAVKAVLDVPKVEAKQQVALRKLFHSYIRAKPSVVDSQVAALVQRLKDNAMRRQEHEESNPVKPGEATTPGGRRVNRWTDYTEEEDIDLEDIYGPELSCSPTEAQSLLRQLQHEDDRIQELMLRLSEEYPGDIGIMMPLLLNYLRMNEGEAFFMGANEPHAYLSGDIMEVMARSDNVVRVALTPKYRDVPLLCEMLTYNMGAPPLIPATHPDPCCRRYCPPIQDFELEDITVPAGESYTAAAIPAPALYIALQGSGTASDVHGEQSVHPGIVFFVPAHTEVNFRVPAHAQASLRVACTHTNMHWRPHLDEFISANTPRAGTACCSPGGFIAAALQKSVIAA